MPILIINHDELFLAETQQTFENYGYKVISSTNSLMALPLFIQHKPRAVIVNVSMPQKDGFEITREIRRLCKKTFILAISSNPLYLRAIKKLGASEALLPHTKPMEIVSAINFSAPAGLENYSFMP